MKETTKYMHHDRMVATFTETKGHHRELCLCHNGCKFFKPDTPSQNCRMAELNYALDKAFGMTTPVLECPTYST